MGAVQDYRITNDGCSTPSLLKMPRLGYPKSSHCTASVLLSLNPLLVIVCQNANIPKQPLDIYALWPKALKGVATGNRGPSLALLKTSPTVLDVPSCHQSH